MDVRQGLEVIGRSSHSRCGQADLTRAGVDLEPAIAVATADAVAQRGASIGISRLNRADHIGIAAVLVIVKCIRRNCRAWIVWIYKHWRLVGAVRVIACDRCPTTTTQTMLKWFDN